MPTIALCGSMEVLPQFTIWKTKLEREGFDVFTPKLVDYRRQFSARHRVLTAKRAENRKHFKKIERSDAILILNYTIGRSKFHIGGSTFAEAAVAFYLGKEIFLLNPIPKDSIFKEELEAWRVKRWNNRSSGASKNQRIRQITMTSQ